MGRYNKRSDFPTAAHHAVGKAIEASNPSGSRRFSELFTDFIALAALSIQQGVQRMIRPDGSKCPLIEEEHAKVARQYKPEGIAAMQEAFAHLVQAIEGPNGVGADGSFEGGDVLGDILMCCDMGNDRLGQVFTPMHICHLMTGLTLGDRQPNSQERFLVHEPCVGGGAMLLALAQHLRQRGFLPWHWWFDATDIDYRCLHMAYIQLSLINAPGWVRRGDSLRMQFDKHWLTPLGAQFYLRPRDLARLRGEAKPAAPVAPPHADLVAEAKQLLKRRQGPQIATPRAGAGNFARTVQPELFAL